MAPNDINMEHFQNGQVPDFQKISKLEYTGSESQKYSNVHS